MNKVKRYVCSGGLDNVYCNVGKREKKESHNILRWWMIFTSKKVDSVH